MRRFFVVVSLGAVAAALGLGCGEGNSKPPLTPDAERPMPMSEPGEPSEPSEPSDTVGSDADAGVDAPVAEPAPDNG